MENAPELITELFETAIKDQEWVENNSPLFEEIAARIRKLEEGNRFNAEQLRKITSLCRDTLLFSLGSRKIDKSLLMLHRPTLSLQFVLEVLLCEKSNPANGLSEQCFVFIREKTGQQITLTSDGILKLKISTLKDETEGFLECLSSLDEETRKKIDIQLAPSFTLNKEELNLLFDKYGKQATSLFLKSPSPSMRICVLLLLLK